MFEELLPLASVLKRKPKKKKKIKHAYKCQSVNSEMFCPLEGICCFVFLLKRIKAARPREHLYMAVPWSCEAARGAPVAGQHPSLCAFFVLRC